MNIEQLLHNNTKTVGNLSEDKLVFVRNKNLQNILNRFDKEEHRLEIATKFQGITFMNDAKSSTVNSVYYTFETLKQKIIWITGGKDEHTDYSDLIDFVAQKVKTIICISENNENIKQQFSAHVPMIYERKNMEEAVLTAFYSAEQNETILLSLACECDATYKDYQDLGIQFKKAIAQL